MLFQFKYSIRRLHLQFFIFFQNLFSFFHKLNQLFLKYFLFFSVNPFQFIRKSNSILSNSFDFSYEFPTKQSTVTSNTCAILTRFSCVVFLIHVPMKHIPVGKYLVFQLFELVLVLLVFLVFSNVLRIPYVISKNYFKFLQKIVDIHNHRLLNTINNFQLYSY